MNGHHRFLQTPFAFLLAALALIDLVSADEPKPAANKATPATVGSKATEASTSEKQESELDGFVTVREAKAAEFKAASRVVQPQPAYFGVLFKADSLTIEEIAPESPAAAAGLASGDQITTIGDRQVKSREELRDVLFTLPTDDSVAVTYIRGKKTKTADVKFSPVSKPLRPRSRTSTPSRPRGYLGVSLARGTDEGVRVARVNSGSGAAKAGLKAGDVIVKIDDIEVDGSTALVRKLNASKPGDKVQLVIRRKEDEKSLEITLGGLTSASGSRYWTKDEYRLAVILVEYEDQKHNEKIKVSDWNDLLFSFDKYKKSSPTGDRVHGSAADYYREISYEKFALKGKVFDWVQVSKKREDYAALKNGRRSTELLGEAVTKLIEREGKDALKDFDGICFVYAGGRYRTSRGGLYWPHRSSFTHGGKRWSYFITAEGGSRMSSISVFCHEFGHMLGLPDLYARPETPGAEGVSVWCAMSNQAGRGRPQHFSAWCKERLGWLKPTVIDPTDRQKIVLSPVENSEHECLKVLVRRDGSEYLLLENRQRRGFDESLPGQGLLIWRVVNGRPLVEESHGIAGPAGPGSYREFVPYPSRSNSSFTPLTTPSSKSKLGDGLPVHITNIRQLPDGRVTLYVGYEFH